MANTLNVDIDVDQSQIQNAVGQIKDAIDTSSSSSQLNQRLGGTFSSGPSGGGPGSHRGSYSIPVHPSVRIAEENYRTSQIFKQGIIQSMQAMKQGALQSATQLGSRSLGAAMPTPPSESQATRAGIQKGGFQFLEGIGQYWTGALATKALIGGSLTGFGLPMAGGIALSMFADKIPGVSETKGYISDAISRSVYGDDWVKPGSKKEASLITGNLLRAEQGAAFGSLFGIERADFLYDKAYQNFAMKQIGPMMKSVASRSNTEVGTMFDIMSLHAITGESAGALSPQNIRNILMDPRIRNEATGEIDKDHPLFRKLKGEMEYSFQHGKGKQTRDLMNRYGYDTNDLAEQYVWFRQLSAGRKKRKSRWTVMGEGFGSAVGFGKAWGRSWTGKNSHIRNQARTTLGMTAEERKLGGGSYGIGMNYMRMVHGDFARGGQYHGLLAPLSQGEMPGDIYSWSGNVASALATPEDQIRFMARSHRILQDQGGEKLVATNRYAHMQQIKLLRESLGGAEGLTNKDLSVMLLKGQNPKLTGHQAEMISAMQLGIGAKVKWVGKGRSRLPPALQKAALGAVERSKMSDADKVGARKAIQQGQFMTAAQRRFFDPDNYSKLRTTLLVNEKITKKEFMKLARSKNVDRGLAETMWTQSPGALMTYDQAVVEQGGLYVANILSQGKAGSQNTKGIAKLSTLNQNLSTAAAMVKHAQQSDQGLVNLMDAGNMSKDEAKAFRNDADVRAAVKQIGAGRKIMDYSQVEDRANMGTLKRLLHLIEKQLSIIKGDIK